MKSTMCNDYISNLNHIFGFLYKICLRCVFKIVLRLKIPNIRFGNNFTFKEWNSQCVTRLKWNLSIVNYLESSKRVNSSCEEAALVTLWNMYWKGLTKHWNTDWFKLLSKFEYQASNIQNQKALVRVWLGVMAGLSRESFVSI